jgi:hypothetical protein
MDNHAVTDSTLADRLGTDCRGLVLNPLFLRWQNLIEQQILSLSNPLGDEYTKSPEAKALYETCLSHAADCACGELPENNILIVHPLFSALDDFDIISGTHLEAQHKSYMDNLFFAFGHARQAGYGLVLFETAQHYAAATSLLSERGVFDRVVITASNQGYTITEDIANELSFLFGKRLHMAGLYNGVCLASICSMVLKYGLCFPKDMLAIKELILDPPCTLEYDPLEKKVIPRPTSTIIPEEIIRTDYSGYRGTTQRFEPPNIVSLQELFTDRMLPAQ